MGAEQTYTIGELCTLVKGTSPTLKTVSGEYPLVVTAAFRRTSLDWQLEGPAVCIPLVSSTGHGDAAIHRVHYQEGKFALANLLVALLPRDPSLCDARYLYYLLQSRKNELLVPLMLGTANVSLKERDIADVTISLPCLDQQTRIVSRIEQMANKVDEARQLRLAASDEQMRLLSAMAHRADLSDKEKSQQGWRRVQLRDVLREYSDAHSVQIDSEYPNFGIYSFGRGLFAKPPINGLQTSATRLFRAKAGLFIYSRLFAFEGAYGIVDAQYEGYYVSNEYPMFVCDEDRLLADFLAAYLLPPAIWLQVAEGSTGLGDRRQRVQPEQLLRQEVFLPPLEWQHKIRKVRQATIDIAPTQAAVAAELDVLMPAVVDRALRGEL
jgi:type I restriction enzyme S subunit